MFVIEIIIETFFSRRYESDIKKIQWYVLCIIPIVTLIMLLITDSYRAIAPKLGPICAGSSLIINIIFFQFYDTLCDYYDKLMNMQQAESQLKLYESQLQYMKATEKKMNAFRHDINNNLSVIRQMAETNRTEELLTFLEQFHASLPKDSLTLYTQHTDFNLLLNYLVEKAKVQNIHPEIHTAIPITLDYNIYDMNILLSNLFDNAIEAAALTDDKILKLQIKYNKGILNIEICNSYDGEILRQGNQYATTKSNKNLHGYGLKNIEKVVEKYEGTLNISHTGNLFTVSIYMFI
jgi:sensor histidine kinase regulating citrate/malate metabolism